MNKVEVAKLLTQISAIDNRQVDEARVEAWFPIVCHYEYQDAVDALPEFFQRSDEYLSPRGLILEIKRLREARALADEKQMRELEFEGVKGEPQPVCRDHDLKIGDCVACRSRLEAMTGLHQNDLHSWAVNNLYRQDSLV